jgi:hypothetical protein
VDEAEYHTTVRHFCLEAEVEEVLMTDLVTFAVAAASAVAFFSFAAVAASVVAASAVAAKVRAVAFAGSPFLLAVVAVVAVVVVVAFVVVAFVEEFDLLAVHSDHPWFLQHSSSMDLTFVVLRRIMLRYYSLFIIYNLNNILFLYYFRIFILIVSWHI